MAWERVFTINDYWDGPRLGIANVSGQPHIYHSDFDESTDDYMDHYLVSPVEQHLFDLVLEDWEIWLRWFHASESGTAALETHPALPEDKARHEDLTAQINDQLKIDPSNSRQLYARFRMVDGNRNNLEVEWSTESLR